MSTKTIAVDTRVYERLAEAKREGESFSRTIERLLKEVASAHTGGEILRSLATFSALPEQDSDAFFEVISRNRKEEPWTRHDLP